MKSKESKMVICNGVCAHNGCHHKKRHKKTNECKDGLCNGNPNAKCIPVEHPQNTEEKKQQPDNPAEVVEKCMLLVNKIQSLAKFQHRVKTLENKVADLEQQIRELKLCDCSLKQQPLIDANVYTETVDLKYGNFTEIPKTNKKKSKQNPH